MSVILTALVPVFLIIALGTVLRRILLKDPAHWAGLERLTYFVLFPALLVVSAVKADLSKVNVLAVTGTLLGAVLVLSITLVALNRPIMAAFKLDGPAFTSLYQGSFRWNTYIALAVAGGLYGAEGITVAAVALVAMIPFLNVIAVVVLAHFAGREPPTVAGVLRQLAQNPYISACLVGAFINYAAIPIPAVVLEFGDVLGRASLAVGLLVVGGGLSISQLARPKAAVYLASVLKLLVKPAIAIGIGLWAGLTPIELAVVVVTASVPSAPAGYVLARQMGGDAALLAEMLTVQILAAAVTMPLMVGLAQSLSH
ncbi:AEC family transporter [Xanthobacter pseudotagetidis]|uniref:AEC family transporter n=1 Tax=Xanthobacter pseudotagetidis TaxID=3119911 RepID=UPI00372A93A2